MKKIYLFDLFLINCTFVYSQCNTSMADSRQSDVSIKNTTSNIYNSLEQHVRLMNKLTDDLSFVCLLKDEDSLSMGKLIIEKE